jgi:hypothetical protein
MHMRLASSTWLVLQIIGKKMHGLSLHMHISIHELLVINHHRLPATQAVIDARPCA